MSEETDRALRAGSATEILGAERHKVNMRIAAYMLAIERVADVHRLRGPYA
jgi:glutamate dehydrogenase/leucine dehydrogenase